MSYSAACRMCLVDNIKMISVRSSQLEEVYEKLANTKLNAENRPHMVCLSCHSQLQKIRKYIDMTQKAERILTHLINNGLQLTPEVVTSLNGGIPLNQIILSTENSLTNPHPEIAVKEECLKEESIDYDDDHCILKTEDVAVIRKRKVSNNIHVIAKRRKEPCKRLSEYKPINSASNTTVNNQRPKIQEINEKPFACDKCSKAFSQMGNLTRHKRLHTGGKPHICDICNKSFAEKVYLKVHRQIHSEEKRYSCGSCEKTFVQKCNLQRHERTHTGEKPFSCSKCPKTFSDMSQLKCHMRFHTKDKPYACDRCGLRFSNVSNFNSHLRTHTGEKPYSCNICFKTFPRSTTLKSHMLIHSGAKPFDCTKCNKNFKSIKYLKRHMRVHTGEKPFACDICGKSYTVKKSLKKHMSIHTGEKS